MAGRAESGRRLRSLELAHIDRDEVGGFERPSVSPGSAALTRVWPVRPVAALPTRIAAPGSCVDFWARHAADAEGGSGVLALVHVDDLQRVDIFGFSPRRSCTGTAPLRSADHVRATQRRAGRDRHQQADGQRHGNRHMNHHARADHVRRRVRLVLVINGSARAGSSSCPLMMVAGIDAGRAAGALITAGRCGCRCRSGRPARTLQSMQWPGFSAFESARAATRSFAARRRRR